ncbi:MAG: hypothetical protein GY801_47160 [bacterium]|nr:hypothetical protein [bacterium]
MGITELEQDLKLIRKIMESSSRYTNIPAGGYIAAGVLGILGAWKTQAFLKLHPVPDLGLLGLWEIKPLALTWFLIFLLAVGIVVVSSWRKAKKHHVSAWNSLAARMFLSQIPLLIVSGMLTFAMGAKGDYDLIPCMWLGIHGSILYSFSYFTGIEHKIEGSFFVLLGILAAFAPLRVQPMLLGLGFGGVHLLAGAWRVFLQQKGAHVSESVE